MILGASNCISTLNLNSNENFIFWQRNIVQECRREPASHCDFDTYSNWSTRNYWEEAGGGVWTWPEKGGVLIFFPSGFNHM